MKTCGYVSSRNNNKKQAGSYFVMRAGLRNNEFCLHGLIAIQGQVSIVSKLYQFHIVTVVELLFLTTLSFVQLHLGLKIMPLKTN